MNNELKIRLEQHTMWLLDSSKGQKFVAKSDENLRYANLSAANLSFADLRAADLRYANLSAANLRAADLRYANLSAADLRFADLRAADLRYANLSAANLRAANLRFADLRFADLRAANGFKFIPLQIVNTKYFITILDDHILWGCKKMTFDEVKNFKFYDCEDKTWVENEFKLNKKIITEMIRYYRNES
jgi:hypothetical protein